MAAASMYVYVDKARGYILSACVYGERIRGFYIAFADGRYLIAGNQYGSAVDDPVRSNDACVGNVDLGGSQGWGFKVYGS